MKQLKWLFLSLTLLAAAGAHAEYPDRIVRLIVPFAAGDALDSSARVFAELLRPALGQPVIVENRPGAAGDIAAEAVAKSSADGYTLLYGTTAMMTITPYVRKSPYDPAADFAPVARVATLTALVAVNRDFPAANWSEFVDLARRNPGKYSFASSGEGTMLHLAGEQLQSAATIKLLHVPYKGMAQAITDFLSGQINIVLEPAVIQHVRAGRGKALAVFSDRRLPELPNVPTLKELGVATEIKPWFGIFAPRATPREIVARLSGAISQITERSEFKEKLPPAVFSGYVPPEAFAKSIGEERAIYQAIIKRLNLRLN